MTLISLVVVLVVVGLLLWAVQQLPLDGTIKTIIRVVVIVVVCLWLLSAVGLLPGTFIRVR
ncbi:MAG: Thivi_2564 family membrane protein [Nitrospiraceae bacterium]